MFLFRPRTYISIYQRSENILSNACRGQNGAGYDDECVLVTLCKKIPISHVILLTTNVCLFFLAAVIFVGTSPQDTPQGNNDRKFQN